MDAIPTHPANARAPHVPQAEHHRPRRARAHVAVQSEPLRHGTGDGPAVPGALQRLHFAPKAKRIIYMFMSGAPSHLDLFDPKPKLIEMTGKDLPDSVRKGQRITTMTSGQKNLLCVGSPFKFAKYGQAQMDISELLPHLTKVVDDCTFVRSLHTDPINHDPGGDVFRHRPPAAGPARDGRMARLRSRQRQSRWPCPRPRPRPSR